MARLPEHGGLTWKSLAEVAMIGLSETYADGQTPLPFTRRLNGQHAASTGHSIRYALICVVGLRKASATFPAAADLAHELWKCIAPVSAARLPAGDLGLGLWARSLSRDEMSDFSVGRALRQYQEQPEGCDSVDLAWLLLGADHAVSAGMDGNQAMVLAEEVKHALLALYNPGAGLFYRHARRGLVHAVSRRVACFANQVYPVMALSVHARRTGCQEAADVARAVADNLCRLQGPLGQWWWLYDARGGGVVDGYPVFSVHQHGMAPMALLEAGQVVGRSYVQAIERGLAWLSMGNELSVNMVLPEHGLIQRNIHRRAYGRVHRMIHGVLWCCGRHEGGAQNWPGAQFEINPECRPYELGWLLYAAGSILHVTGSKVTVEEGEACPH